MVTIKVIEKHFHYPVPGAAVNTKDIVSLTDDAEAYAELTKTCGYFIGWTNRKGEVYHRFRQPYRYVLVAVKDGLVPGFAKIAIKPLQPVEPINTAIPE